MSSPLNPTALNKTFYHTSSTHSFAIKWTSLGPPTSPPVIFIHGTPWSSRVWVSLALALSRTYRVYLFDNPGFGDSPLEEPLPDSVWTPKNEVERLDADLGRQSEAIASLFKMWKMEEGWQSAPHVIAHDHGGLMSLRGNLLHGCVYASLCLIDVVAVGPFGQPLFASVASNPTAFETLPDMTFEGILSSYISHAAFHALSPSTLEVLKAPWLRDDGKKGFVRQLCQAAHRSTGEVENRYKEVGESMPVLVLWGREDRWIDVKDAGRLGEKLGARKVVIIEGAGHLVMYDQPAQLGVELGGWLTEVGK